MPPAHGLHRIIKKILNEQLPDHQDGTQADRCGGGRAALRSVSPHLVIKHAAQGLPQQKPAELIWSQTLHVDQMWQEKMPAGQKKELLSFRFKKALVNWLLVTGCGYLLFGIIGL